MKSTLYLERKSGISVGLQLSILYGGPAAAGIMHTDSLLRVLNRQGPTLQ